MDTSVGLSSIASLSLGLSMSMTGAGRQVMRNLGTPVPPGARPNAARFPVMPAQVGCHGAAAAPSPVGSGGANRRASFVGLLHQMSTQNRLLERTGGAEGGKEGGGRGGKTGAMEQVVEEDAEGMDQGGETGRVEGSLSEGRAPWMENGNTRGANVSETQDDRTLIPDVIIHAAEAWTVDAEGNQDSSSLSSSCCSTSQERENSFQHLDTSSQNRDNFFPDRDNFFPDKDSSSLDKNDSRTTGCTIPKLEVESLKQFAFVQSKFNPISDQSRIGNKNSCSLPQLPLTRIEGNSPHHRPTHISLHSLCRPAPSNRIVASSLQADRAADRCAAGDAILKLTSEPCDAKRKSDLNGRPYAAQVRPGHVLPDSLVSNRRMSGNAELPDAAWSILSDECANQIANPTSNIPEQSVPLCNNTTYQGLSNCGTTIQLSSDNNPHPATRLHPVPPTNLAGSGGRLPPIKRSRSGSTELQDAPRPVTRRGQRCTATVSLDSDPQAAHACNHLGANRVLAAERNDNGNSLKSADDVTGSSRRSGDDVIQLSARAAAAAALHDSNKNASTRLGPASSTTNSRGGGSCELANNVAGGSGNGQLKVGDCHRSLGDGCQASSGRTSPNSSSGWALLRTGGVGMAWSKSQEAAVGGGGREGGEGGAWSRSQELLPNKAAYHGNRRKSAHCLHSDRVSPN